MKKQTKRIISLLLACVMVLTLAPVALATPVVPGPGTPLQDAINAAAPGATIIVGAGHFNEHILIDRNITLIAENAATGDLATDTRVPSFRVVGAVDVTIQGFHIYGRASEGSSAFEPASIHVNDGATVAILDNFITNPAFVASPALPVQFGVVIGSGAHVTIADNEFNNILIGVWLNDYSPGQIGTTSVTGNAFDTVGQVFVMSPGNATNIPFAGNMIENLVEWDTGGAARPGAVIRIQDDGGGAGSNRPTTITVEDNDFRTASWDANAFIVAESTATLVNDGDGIDLGNNEFNSGPPTFDDLAFLNDGTIENGFIPTEIEITLDEADIDLAANTIEFTFMLDIEGVLPLPGPELDALLAAVLAEIATAPYPLTFAYATPDPANPGAAPGVVLDVSTATPDFTDLPLGFSILGPFTWAAVDSEDRVDEFGLVAEIDGVAPIDLPAPHANVTLAFIDSQYELLAGVAVTPPINGGGTGGGGVAITRASLQARVDAAQLRAQTNYTPTSWATLAQARTDAQTVLNNPSATQAQIAAAYNALREAYNRLTAVSTTPNQRFADVAPTNWFYNAVMFVYEANIMDGTGATTFEPHTRLSRAMVATTLHRMAGSPTGAFEVIFPDVAQGRWYANAVIWAYNNDVVTGFPDSTFGPNELVTREQFAAMLFRFAEAMGEDLSVPGNFTLDFPDANLVGNWALTYMSWAVYNGLIEGTPQGLNPKGTATRAECATILMRFVEVFVN